MKYLMIPFTVALLASQSVFADQCTTDEIDIKARELAERVNALAENDPKRAAEINEELSGKEFKRTADQLGGDECKAYEQRIKHVEQAEKQADIAPAKAR